MAIVIKKNGTKMIPVNCLVEAGLKDAAKEQGINFTKCLRDGLKKELEQAQAGRRLHNGPAQADIGAPSGNNSLHVTQEQT